MVVSGGEPKPPWLAGDQADSKNVNEAAETTLFREFRRRDCLALDLQIRGQNRTRRLNANVISQLMPTTVVQKINRNLPIGAEVIPGGGVHFRVWAPKPRRIELVLRPESSQVAEGESIELEEEGMGYRSVLVEHAKAGMRYGYRLNSSDPLRPDPASRFQPDGPSGLSQIVDPHSFHWGDGKWQGKGALGHVLYEMHIGTFTKAGTFAAAANELPELKRIGITTVELMPVADFPGRFGWGYDGVNMFAPSRLYGVPDDFRRFVDRAHHEGLAVILDVVYNHFGNVDNYLHEFADHFKSASTANGMGRRDQFRRRELSGGARVFCDECAVLDRRVSSRRFSLRCDTVDLRRFTAAHSGGLQSSGPRCRGGRRSADFFSSRE